MQITQYKTRNRLIVVNMAIQKRIDIYDNKTWHIDEIIGDNATQYLIKWQNTWELKANYVGQNLKFKRKKKKLNGDGKNPNNDYCGKKRNKSEKPQKKRIKRRKI